MTTFIIRVACMASRRMRGVGKSNERGREKRRDPPASDPPAPRALVFPFSLSLGRLPRRLSLASLVSLASRQSRVRALVSMFVPGFNPGVCFIINPALINLDWRHRHFNSTAKISIAKRFTRRNLTTCFERTGWRAFERSTCFKRWCCTWIIVLHAFLTLLSLYICYCLNTIEKCPYWFVVDPGNSENLLLNFEDGHEGEETVGE